MDFWRTILGLLRRRYVGPPVLVLSAVLAVVTFLLVPTRFVSTATMVLTTSATGATLPVNPTEQSEQTNPFLNYDERLRTSAAILIQAMGTPEIATELGAGKGGPTTLTINDGRTTPQLLGATGPFVYIEAESTSATEARDVIVRAQQRMREELVNRQKSLNAPPATFVTMVDVVPATAPLPRTGTKWQSALGALALGVVFGIGGAYAALRRFEARQARSPAEPAERDSRDAAADVPREEPAVVVAKTNGVHPAHYRAEDRAEERRRRWSTVISRPRQDVRQPDDPAGAEQTEAESPVHGIEANGRPVPPAEPNGQLRHPAPYATTSPKEPPASGTANPAAD